MRRAASFFLLLALVLPGAPARADEMDITLSRLGEGDQPLPDDRAFAALMTQLGVAVSAPSLAPARTLGADRPPVALRDAVLVDVREHVLDGDEDGITEGDAGPVRYWHMGTVGDAQSTRAEGNPFAESMLNFTRLALRKGLPFGLELGASVGHVYQTSLFLWSAEVRLGLFEGYRRRWPAFLPDLALRAAVTTVTGDDELNLTVPLAEVILSKGLRVGADTVLTPMVSGQMVWIVAESNVVTLVTPDDVRQRVVFADMRDVRYRMSAGAQLRHRMFTFTAAARFDLVSPGAGDNLAPDDVARQWTLDLGAGVTY